VKKATALTKINISKNSDHFECKRAGFTLIELIVVISIFLIITSIALFNQGRLNSQSLLTNMTYDIALSIREAQSYGIGVKTSTPVGEAYVENRFGINIDLDQSPYEIQIFNDVGPADATDTGIGIYDSASEAVGEPYSFSGQRGNKIQELCAGDIDTALQCQDTGFRKLAISFKRPNPEALFMADGAPVQGPVYIVVHSIDGDRCRAVVVQQTGAISVEDGDSVVCP
jgi:prepilin-type N-terminal cleavage/methylation domain-containing protein